MNKNKSEWIYLHNGADTVRYVLGETGENIVACIGINPSTARPNDLDNTLKSVKRIAAFNGFDGWMMYNVYPQRATDPTDLDAEMNGEEQQKNSAAIRQSVKSLGIHTIWVAYGDLIETRDYLPYCLADLYMSLRDLKVNWKIVQNPTQKGHPRHPLYKSSKSELVAFDMDAYMSGIMKAKVASAGTTR